MSIFFKYPLDLREGEAGCQCEHQQYPGFLTGKIPAADGSERIIILRTVAVDETIGAGAADDGDLVFELFNFALPRGTQIAVADTCNDYSGGIFCRALVEPVGRGVRVGVKHPDIR